MNTQIEEVREVPVIPVGYIRKEDLETYLERTINRQEIIVKVYVQDKCFEGGKLSAYKEILSEIKKM